MARKANYPLIYRIIRKNINNNIDICLVLLGVCLVNTRIGSVFTKYEK